jgi:hypothetical protein
MALSKKQIEKRSAYDRVTEILKEQGHSAPEDASEFERFRGAMKFILSQPTAKK